MKILRFVSDHKLAISMCLISFLMTETIAQFFLATNPVVKMMALVDSFFNIGLFLFFWAILRVDNKNIALRDQFINMASHELKTPLTTIIMQLEIMQRHEKVHPMATLALEASQTMSKLIESFLDITKIRFGRVLIFKVDADLVPLLQTAIKKLKAEDQVISLESPPSMKGYFDPDKITQIFEQILSNAIRYGEGKVIEVLASKENGNAVITVLDHGQGISEENQKKIFGRLENVDKIVNLGGPGLGLFISTEILKVHGGSLTVKSEVGKGSTFTLKIPLV